MQKWFEQQWQSRGLAQIILLPLSWLFQLLAVIRRHAYQRNWFKSYALSVPVIVIGNITVGGTGKTPLVVLLAEQLKNAGYTPGIISRGYGGTQVGEVFAHSLPSRFGDEPVLIAKRTACPIWVNADRVMAGQGLLAAHPNCNVIISDDGLQHYRLKREIEIVVLNSKHSFGNRRLLPAGPLREKLSRLTQVLAIVDTSRIGPKYMLEERASLPPLYSMSLLMQGIYSLDESRKISLSELQHQPVVAIAGIGHPDRFFSFIKGLGLNCEYLAFNDHHAFNQQDFAGLQDKTILMTEKDAVKCKHLELNNAWYLPVSAILATTEQQTTLINLIIQQLNKTKD
jgi:tetraacyldisaccharide 4'-kinase